MQRSISTTSSRSSRSPYQAPAARVRLAAMRGRSTSAGLLVNENDQRKLPHSAPVSSSTPPWTMVMLPNASSPVSTEARVASLTQRKRASSVAHDTPPRCIAPTRISTIHACALRLSGCAVASVSAW